MYRSAFQWIAIFVVVAIFVGGCSRGRPMGDVQGKVTLNGQPLSKGAVRFVPVNGETQATGGTIQDGSFRVAVPVAKQRVEISANEVDLEKTPPNANGDQIVMKILVPPRYNIQSELTLDVVAGLNEPEYQLTNP
jgi:hypothetical protein